MRSQAFPKAFATFCLLCAAAFASDGHLFFDPRISRDDREFQTGVRLGDEEGVGDFRLSAFWDVDFRPLPTGSRVKVAETREYVVRDAWYSMGPGVGAAWPLASSLYLTAATGVGRSFGGGEGAWGGWLDAGFRVPMLERSYWSVLYQYHPAPGEADHRMALQFRLRAI